MGALQIMHIFRLSERGVRCGADGLYVGATPLLRRDAYGEWAPRPREEIESELAELYGLPIDLSRKTHGIATAAGALNRGDAALAAIAAVLLGLPDPPGLAKDAPVRRSDELAMQLAASGLLKGDWDPNEHPRAGCPPNAGWFAQKPQESNRAGASPELWLPSAPRDLFRLGAQLARSALSVAADLSADAGEVMLRLAFRASGVIEAIIDLLDSSELNRGDQQVVDQLRSSMDPARTLEQLQQPPTENKLGYQRHHSVEQNPANVEKSPITGEFEKFGRAALDDPCNLFWVPTYRHELIAGYYSSNDAGDPSRMRREVVNDLDFPAQFEAGLEAMRRYGVLK